MNKTQRAVYATALRMLGRREYCEAQLRRKLKQREFEDADVDMVVAELLTHGYLSDTRFAEGYMRTRLRRGETPKVAAMRARGKGVKEAALQEVVEIAQSDFDADQACQDLLSRRDPQGLRFEDERLWQRQARFLQNKGFDVATILRAMKRRPDEEV